MKVVRVDTAQMPPEIAPNQSQIAEAEIKDPEGRHGKGWMAISPYEPEDYLTVGIHGDVGEGLYRVSYEEVFQMVMKAHRLCVGGGGG